MANYTTDETGYLKVKTHRSGHFVFQIGLDFEALKELKERVNEAHIRFVSIPLISEVSAGLEQRVIVSSIYSTNTIEGGELSYEETADILNLSEDEIKEEKERRVTNLRNAYNFSEEISSIIFSEYEDECRKENKEALPGDVFLKLSEDMFKDLHELITVDLIHNLSKPKIYRDNEKGQKTKVGHADVGGVYQPPKCRDDINMLMEAFCAWANSEPVRNLPALFRAPLIHNYFELIHPFWDGNGRTGRIAEATILRASGYEYAPHGMAKYYLDNVERYFTLLSTCRKRSKNNEINPNTPFLIFFLEGMLNTVNRLHDRANKLISSILVRARLEHLISSKEITVRQHNVLSNLIVNKEIRARDILKLQPWYKSLYSGVSERTSMRDLKKLSDLNLIKIESSGKIQIIILESKVKLVSHPYSR